MANVYELNRPEPLKAPSEGPDYNPPIIKVLTPDEFSDMPDISQEGRDGLAALAPSESNFVELYPDFIIGSFAVPDKADPTEDPDLLSFYLENDHLIFIDNGTVAEDLLAKVHASGMLVKPTTPHTLYAFMKTLITNDFVWINEMEDAMEELEDAMVERGEEVSSQTIMDYRRAATRMGSYYEQVAIMADIIADNENKVMSRREAESFNHVVTHANFLASRAEMLREYSLQLYELHQTQIDLKQNSTMQILTIVTVMFAPLTLVTGWFGMNLTVLPGLDWPYMAFTIIGLAILMIILMVVFFKKKRWL